MDGPLNLHQIHIIIDINVALNVTRKYLKIFMVINELDLPFHLLTCKIFYK